MREDEAKSEVEDRTERSIKELASRLGSFSREHIKGTQSEDDKKCLLAEIVSRDFDEIASILKVLLIYLFI